MDTSASTGSDGTAAVSVARLLEQGALVIAMTGPEAAQRVGHACSVTLLLPDGQVRVLTADHDLLAGCGGCAPSELR